MIGRKPRSADYIELPPTRQRIEHAIDDELLAHIDERVAELTAAGPASLPFPSSRLPLDWAPMP